jgi:Cd(II)/Pb(II)-responsive transcriptional regulator
MVAMKIGELAHATQTPVQTIRYYEREALLPLAPRSEGNYRIYGPAHAERLGFVRHCRSLDMSLDEIRVLLSVKDAPSAQCGDVNALLDVHMGQVAARIRSLRQLEKQLKALRLRCGDVQDAAHCGILSGLAQAASVPQDGVRGAKAPQAKAHVAGAHAPGLPRH